LAFVFATAAALRDRVDEAAGHAAAAADPEQHQAPSHQEGEHDVDHLDGPAPAGASEVEEH
jgi:hypothetical protein